MGTPANKGLTLVSHTGGDRATTCTTSYRAPTSAILLSESPLVHGVMDSWQSAFAVFVPPTRNSTELICISGFFIITS